MPAPLKTIKASDGPEDYRHVTVNLPWPMFEEIVDFAESEGRSFSLQLRWMLQESINRRNGGKVR